MKLSSLLGQSAYWQVNKYVARYFKDNNTALLLSDLVDKQDFFEERGELTKDGYFFNTSEQIQKDTNISYTRQKKCINLLEDEGLITTKRKGIPAKLHFKINQNKIWEFLKPSIAKNAKQDTQKTQGNNNKEEETIERINYNNIISEIINHLNKVSGKRYRDTTRTTRDIVRARLKEGFTIDDFKTVHEKKSKEWKGTEWEAYLRPSTLYAPSKFEGYLNQSEKPSKNGNTNKNNYTGNSPEKNIQGTFDYKNGGWGNRPENT